VITQRYKTSQKNSKRNIPKI